MENQHFFLGKSTISIGQFSIETCYIIYQRVIPPPGKEADWFPFAKFDAYFHVELTGKRLQLASENGPVEIVDLPSEKMVIFHSCVSLPEGKRYLKVMLFQLLKIHVFM